MGTQPMYGIQIFFALYALEVGKDRWEGGRGWVR